MSASKSSTFDQYESDVRSYCRMFPAILEKAKDSYLFDSDGKQYIDFFCGAGAINYGHNNELIRDSLIEYMQQDGIMMSLDFHSQSKERFIVSFQDKVLKPRGLNYKMQFTSPTGTSVVESAVKLARKHTNRQNIITFTNAFHGMSGNSLSLTGSKHHRQDVSYGMVTRLPYDGYLGKDFDYIGYYRKLLQDQSSGVDLPAAIILETLQGEGGLNMASPNWLRGIRELCDEFDIVLIVDDIQAGCGRTGRFFSFERAEIVPDMVCLSKSIGAIGLPCALLLFKPEMDQWKKGEDNGTFRGNNLAFVAAEKMIDLYWTDFEFERALEHKSRILTLACQQIHKNFPERISETKGIGFMQGIQFNDPNDAKTLIDHCAQSGLLMESCGPDDQVVKIMPALTIEESVLQEGLSIIDRESKQCFDNERYVKEAVFK